MPRKKKSSSKSRNILVTLVVGIVAFGLIAWHDGLIGASAISEINAGNVDNGTSVTVKGEI